MGRTELTVEETGRMGRNNKNNKQNLQAKPDTVNKNNTETTTDLKSKNEVSKDEKADEVKPSTVETPKPTGISLPMTGSSDDWMDDDVGLTMDDEDEDDDKVVEPEKAEIEKQPPVV